jgi:protein O-mannosyl-transferase
MRRILTLNDRIRDPEQIINTAVWLVVLIAVGVIVFGGYTYGKWMYEDDFLIEHSRWYEKPLNSSFLKQDLGITLSDKPAGFYRPGEALLFRALYDMFGKSTMNWRASAIAIHILASCALFFLAGTLLKNVHGAGVAALLFMLHPCADETVGILNYMSASAEGLLAFLCLLLWLRGRTTASIPFMIGALSMRESSLVLPLVMAALFPIHPAGCYKKKLLAAAPAAFIACLYLFLRFGIFQIPLLGNEATYPFFTRVGYTVYLWVKGILFAVPSNMSVIHDEEPAMKMIYIGWTIVVMFIFVVVFIFQKAAAEKEFTAASAFGAFIITAAPFSGAITQRVLFAEHYVYIPLAFLICGTTALALKKANRKILILFPAILAGYYAIVSHDRASVFRDNRSLFLEAVANCPNSFSAHNNLGMEFLEHGKFEEAVREFDAALTAVDGTSRDVTQEMIKAHYNLGVAYQEAGVADSAISEYLKVESLSGGNHGRAWNNLGDIHFKRGDYGKAEEYMLKAGKTGRKNLAVLYFTQEKFDELNAILDDLYKENPSDPVVKKIYETTRFRSVGG